VETEQDVVELTPRRRRVPGWLLVVAVLVVLGGLARLEQGKSSSTATPVSPSSASPSVVPFDPTSPPVQPSPSPVRPRVENLGHRLLGVTAGWELFARRSDEVVRIQLALGRVTHTPVPALNGSEAVAFVAASDRVLVRPWNNVPGYVVRDGAAARELGADAGHRGPMYPGPDADHLWVLNEDGGALSLIGLDGARAGRSIPLPASDQWWPAAADGAGYVVVRGIGGDYVARPEGLQRISTGSVIAGGTTGWLAVECDAHARCAKVVIDRSTGVRQRLGGAPSAAVQPAGLIAPDGSFAAVYTFTSSQGSGGMTMHLIDLASGTHRRLPVIVTPDSALDATMAWSPDSRWLFAISEGRLVVIDPRSGAVGDLGVALGPVEQLAVRTAWS